jgi:hypothetical protein
MVVSRDVRFTGARATRNVGVELEVCIRLLAGWLPETSFIFLFMGVKKKVSLSLHV